MYPLLLAPTCGRTHEPPLRPTLTSMHMGRRPSFFIVLIQLTLSRLATVPISECILYCQLVVLAYSENKILELELEL